MNQIITIGREFGSGDRKLGWRISEKLKGVCYRNADSKGRSLSHMIPTNPTRFFSIGPGLYIGCPKQFFCGILTVNERHDQIDAKYSVHLPLCLFQII